MMEFIGELVLAFIGFLYLKIRYRDKKVILKVLDEKYHGKYHAVGIAIVLNSIAAIGAVAMFLGIIYIVIAAAQGEMN